MIQRAFGQTGRRVSVVGQGSWNIPERGAAAEEAKAALRRGIELGMVHIDTAEMYGDGRAEEVIGDAIRGLSRERLFIVSKVLPSNASYTGTIRACERSLKRLGTDYLDCYLLHWRGSHPLADTMRALEKLVDDGKTRALGVSNFDVEDLEEAQEALERHPIACNQVLYHLHERGIEHRVLPWCAEQSIAIVAYTPFGRRASSGKALEAAARAHGVGIHAVILAFLTRDESVFAIPKAASVGHVEENAKAGELRLNESEIVEIDAAFPRPRSPELKTL
ncbi:MAG: aldo/keto reductase [Candidatus Eremiobacteraeota bacterium]|nr:aldo/keto reductase [Candidatus Eremiobacteraeota bacterium]MBV8355221.1 aldo/keto reductase [Candidatus Eremiobacteraeota bacterium]